MLRYFRDEKLKPVLRMLLAVVLCMSFASSASAQGSGGGSGGASGSGSGSSSSASGAGGGNNGTLSKPVANDGLQTGAFDVREDYRRANKLSIPFGPPTRRNPEGLDEVVKRESIGPATIDHGSPVYAWPVVIPAATSAVPTRRDVGITKHKMKTFGLPISDTQYQIIHRMDQQIMLEEIFDPERIMWLAACIGTSQVQDTSNSFANIIRQQAASAIDYVSCTIVNFTTQKNNKWNKIRDQLFMPMAILLLLPGAMLAQVKVIVASGMPIGGADTSPFEGIVRSIVAIFLIPATYLVVNYSVDINNSLTVTISDNYSRIFGSNMYKDALCMVIKAFPLRQSHENRNGIYKEVVPWDTQADDGNTPAAGLEERTLQIKEEDPCAGVFKTDPDRADEQAPFASVGQRFFTNMTNAILAMTWNVLCAFQVVFLMYLWLVGPVIAALWVYPHDTLRGAFPGWVEGVVTLAFWGLFWNTTVLLMACFKGCDATGSIIASALMFLSIQSVKSAFDFAGLVKEAGSQVAGAMNHAANEMAKQSKAGVAGGGGGGKHGGGGGGGARHVGGGGGGKHGGGGGGGAAGHAASSAHAGVVGAAAHGPGSMPSSLHAAGGASMNVSGTVSAAGGAHVGGGMMGGSGAMHGGKGSDIASSGSSLVSHGTTGGLSGTGTGTAGGMGGDGERGVGMQGERGGSGSGADYSFSTAAPSAASGPVVPPSLSAGDINVSNSSSFSSFNANSLTGTVDGAQGRYTAGEAAGLIGRENLANFPREGQVMSKEQALANFNQASKEVAEKNAMGFGAPGDDAKRNDIMDKWKSELLEANQHSSADGKLIGVPDSLPGTAAGGNWNLPAEGAGGAGGPMPQGFNQVFDNVNGAIQNASAALMMPGAAEGQGLPLNPQAVQGLSGLAKEMTEVGPQLAGMSPQAQGATIEAWQQKAEVLSQQMYSGVPPSGETYQRMSAELQQAQYSMSQFQQSYPAGGGDSTTYSSATYSQSGDVYQQPGSSSGGAEPQQYQGGQAGYQQQADPGTGGYGAGGGGGYYQQSAPQGDPGSYSQGAGSSQSGPQIDQSSSYYNQGGAQTGQSGPQQFDQGSFAGGSYSQQSAPQGQQIDQSNYFNQGVQQGAQGPQQIDQSSSYSQQNVQQGGDQYNQASLQQQMDRQSGGYYASQQTTHQADQTNYSTAQAQQQQQSSDQNTYYTQQQSDQSTYYSQSQADQQAYAQQQQQYQQQVDQSYQQQYQQSQDPGQYQQQSYQQPQDPGQYQQPQDQGQYQQQSYQQPQDPGQYQQGYQQQSADPGAYQQPYQQQSPGDSYYQTSYTGGSGEQAGQPQPVEQPQQQQGPQYTQPDQHSQQSSPSQGPAPQSHPNYSMPAPSQSFQRERPADKPPAPASDKPADKPQEKPAAPPAKEQPKHAIDPMKFNPLKQKAPPKKKPEDGPTPPPPKE